MPNFLTWLYSFMVKKRKAPPVVTSNNGAKTPKLSKVSTMKSTPKNGSIDLRDNPKLTVSFYNVSILDAVSDAIALACTKELLINRTIFDDLCKRSKPSSLETAFAKAKSQKSPNSIHGGSIVVVDLTGTNLPFKYILLVVEPDSFHIGMASRALFDTVQNLQLESVASVGLGCGTLKVGSQKSASKLKEAITEHIKNNKLTSLKEIAIFDRSMPVLNDFMAIFGSSVELPSGSSSSSNDSQLTNFVPLEKVADDVCVICLVPLKEGGDFVVAIRKCNHMFHNKCFDSLISQSSMRRCPTCQVYFSFPEGNMPLGSTMTHNVVNDRINIEGGRGYIQIHYSIPSGIQDATHPRPGRRFHGTSRQAYLPNTPEGEKVLKLLRKAFDCRLTFTVGDSVTTGAQDVVVWNNIHHKTSLTGGSSSFGYPDPDYLARVTDELRAAGITEEMLDA